MKTHKYKIRLNFSFFLISVQFICSVVSDSLWPHESQHARPPCPSPTPGVHPNSRPSSQWCHPAIYSFVNWRIIALQNFVVFCQTSTWISHRYIYILSLLNLTRTRDWAFWQLNYNSDIWLQRTREQFQEMLQGLLEFFPQGQNCIEHI